jgi:hypothetical protein
MADSRCRPGRATSRSGASKFVLYDLKSDAVTTQLDIGKEGLAALKFKRGSTLQWTGDGRYLYYVDLSVDSGGRRRTKCFTRIWDVRKSREAAILDGVTPVGPGPNGTMVMRRRYFATSRPSGDDAYRTLLHDPASGSLRGISNPRDHVLDVQGKWLLLLRDDANSVLDKVCIAKIVLPAKP